MGHDDPFRAWIADNLETLASFGSGFVAIHPVRGVLVFDSDEDRFGSKLSKVAGELRAECLYTHTDLYVGSHATPIGLGR